MSILNNKSCKVIREESTVKYKYYDTIVAEVNEDGVKLFTGGFSTRSTKNLMNEVLSKHESDWRIVQKRFRWICTKDGYNKLFTEGIVLDI